MFSSPLATALIHAPLPGTAERAKRGRAPFASLSPPWWHSKMLWGPTVHRSLELGWITLTGQEWAGSNQRFQGELDSKRGNCCCCCCWQATSPVLFPWCPYPETVVTNNFLKKNHSYESLGLAAFNRNCCTLCPWQLFLVGKGAAGWKLTDVASHLRKSKYTLFPWFHNPCPAKMIRAAGAVRMTA